MSLENLDKSLAAVVDQLNHIAQANGADAILLAGRIEQLKAQSTLYFASQMWWGVAAFLAAALVFGAVAVWRSARKPNDIDAGVFPGFISGILGILTAVWFAISFFYNVNVYTDLTLKAAAADPKIALAAAVLAKIEK